MPKIKIHYFSDDLPRLQATKIGDWIDLYCAQDMTLKAGDFALVPLGVSMQLPEGYEARTAPRSSTFKRWGLLQANSVGIIDNSYCGTNDEWKLPVYATRDTVLEKGDRICQFRIFEIQPPLSLKSARRSRIRTAAASARPDENKISRRRIKPILRRDFVMAPKLCRHDDRVMVGIRKARVEHFASRHLDVRRNKKAVDRQNELSLVIRPIGVSDRGHGRVFPSGAMSRISVSSIRSKRTGCAQL